MTPLAIKTINLWDDHFIMKYADGVNCYLVNTDSGFILIDSGFQSKRDKLLAALEGAGCMPGTLKLIIITHGDVDHIGNCAYLRERYNTKIATHQAELKSVEHGNMAANRRNKPGVGGRLVLTLISWMSRRSHFKPDFFIEEGFSLTDFGLDATILHLPGHSMGSIGLWIPSTQALFCGDLLWNVGKPEPQPNSDDPIIVQTSLEKLMKLPFEMAYPGHGKPFKKEAFWGESR